jgi:hypothetical protein
MLVCDSDDHNEETIVAILQASLSTNGFLSASLLKVTT